MNDLLRKTISLGFGLFAVTKEKAEEWVEELVKRGEMAPQESRELIEQLLEKGEKQRQELKRLIQEQVGKSLQDWKLARQSDVEALREEVRRLREEVEALKGQKD